jgi:hypothetical protein
MAGEHFGVKRRDGVKRRVWDGPATPSALQEEYALYQARAAVTPPHVVDALAETSPPRSFE